MNNQISALNIGECVPLNSDTVNVTFGLLVFMNSHLQALSVDIKNLEIMLIIDSDSFFIYDGKCYFMRCSKL